VAAQPLELARVRYRRGVEAYEEGRFREAIDLFLDADELAPSAALSFNIASAYERIGEPASALRWYRDYLRRDPAAADRAQVEATVTTFETILRQLGVQQVTVSSVPTKAKLSVDGAPVGTTPWTGELSPGSHRLAFTLAGHRTENMTFELAPDHARDVSIELHPEAPAPVPAPPVKVPVAEPARPDPGGSSHKTMKTLGWIGLAAGGAALGGALVFEGLRRGAESDAEQDKTQVGYADKLATMEAHQTTARVLLGVGGALAATGGVLLWLGREPARRGETGVAVTCGPGGCMSSVRGRF
jgi:tetratricopeptide (TPR) repeat protein